MTERRVRFTATASQHVARERAWWLANRDAQEVFATELQDAIQILAMLPGAGAAYTQSDTSNLRRLYLRKIACHVYYTFDADEVVVRALWGAKRERGPTL